MSAASDPIFPDGWLKSFDFTPPQVLHVQGQRPGARRCIPDFYVDTYLDKQGRATFPHPNRDCVYVARRAAVVLLGAPGKPTLNEAGRIVAMPVDAFIGHEVRLLIHVGRKALPVSTGRGAPGESAIAMRLVREYDGELVLVDFDEPFPFACRQAVQIGVDGLPDGVSAFIRFSGDLETP